MKSKILLAIVLGVSALIVGCGDAPTMTDKEANAIKNPSKSIPPEAAAGMAKMGELTKKQQEANKAAGVDSRGIPIGKSTDGNSAPAIPGSN